MTIGDRIKKIREEMNMTQGELAKYINSTKQTIYKYENNIVTNIPSDKIEKMAEVLETTPAALMGWTIPNEKEVNERNGNNIKSFREEKGLSQEQLAKIADVTKGEIEAWENGQLSPKMNALFKIADKFDTSVGNILKDSPMSNNFLNEKDEKDIAKRIEELNADLESQEILMLDGEVMDDETRELIKAALSSAVRISKIKAKEKFNPNKNKK